MKVVLKSNDIKESSKVFRYALTENCYFALNLKMFIYEYTTRLLSPTKNRDAVKACIKKFGIKKADFMLFLRFYDNKNNRRITKAVFREYKKQVIPSPKEVRANFSLMHEVLLKYCRTLTFKKLTFIVNSNNMSPQDMHYELIYKALKTYYLMLPTNKDDLYILNYIKRAIHNHAMNTIQKFKFAKRDRLQGILEADGSYTFNMQTVSENQIRVSGNGGLTEEIDTGAIVNGSTIDKSYEEHDSKATIKKLIRMYKNKKRRLLQLIVGEYDEDFTDFLHRCKKVSKRTNNVELYDTNIEEYKTQACNYLNIERDACDRFLKHVYHTHM